MVASPPKSNAGPSCLLFAPCEYNQLQAGREGAMRIQRKDEKVLVAQPEKTKASPLDVPALDLRFTRKEIVDFVRAGRRPGLLLGARLPCTARKPRRLGF